MLTNLTYLPEGLNKSLAPLITGIAKTISPEKIICYGWRTTLMRDWGCFIEMDGYRETVYPTYDFLIVTNADEKRADHEIIQLCDQQAELLRVRVTCVIHKLAESSRISFAGKEMPLTIAFSSIRSFFTCSKSSE